MVVCGAAPFDPSMETHPAPADEGATQPGSRIARSVSAMLFDNGSSPSRGGTGGGGCGRMGGGVASLESVRRSARDSAAANATHLQALQAKRAAARAGQVAAERVDNVLDCRHRAQTEAALLHASRLEVKERGEARRQAKAIMDKRFENQAVKASKDKKAKADADKQALLAAAKKKKKAAREVALQKKKKAAAAR